MDCIRGMFPFIKVPLSNTSISDIFSDCLNCQPFGKLKKRSVQINTKPSRELKTISSLVDKFATVYDPESGHNTQSNHGLYAASNGFYKPCSRQTSFSFDMNHEKFTPCEKTRFDENDFRQNSINSNSNNSDGYDKIDYNHSDLNNEKKSSEKEKVIVAPPRRKKRPAPKPNLVNCKKVSIESNFENELKKNYQNLKLNNLDKPNARYNENNNNNNNKNNNNNNNNSNKNGCTGVSCLTNNKLINKSGCSNLEVVSDSLVSKAMHFSNFDSISDTANIITDYYETGYCENKIYYKNSSFDKFGNYRHGNDLDEVIVCESFVEFDPTGSRNRSPEEKAIPKNSTFSKFFADRTYSNHLLSESVDDESYEQIVQLQPNTNPLQKNEFSMLKTERYPGEQGQGLQHQNENSIDKNDILDNIELSAVQQVQFVGALDTPENWQANSEKLNKLTKDIPMVSHVETTESSGFDVISCNKRIGIDCQYAETDRFKL